MSPILLHIYGPFAIHSFGVMIAFGLMITLYLLHRDKPLQKLISHEQLTTIFQIAFAAGLAGGRIWFLITNWAMVEHWTDCCMIWSGGLSILGAVLGILLTLAGYFYYQKLPALPILDRIALYTPLLQSISRLGCFFAGCCFGQITNLPWAIIYTDPTSLAPLHVHLHPTQLYSSLFLAITFIILLSFDRWYRSQKPGQILALYLFLSSFDRFVVDFWRGDRELIPNNALLHNLSIQQMLAISVCIAAIIFMTFISISDKSHESI